MTRKEAIEILKKHYMWTGEPSEIVDVCLENKAIQMGIDSLETDESYQLMYEKVEVQPVIHAKWEHISYYDGGYGMNETCSNCGRTIHGQIFDLVDKYCPNCGAKMV